MNQLIDELKAIPGVVGACLYSSRDGLQGTNLPGIFKPDRLAAVGKLLSKLHSAGRMNFDDLTDVSLHYDESVVVVRELQKNLLIFVICDPSFNHNLLSMSFNLLQEEVSEGSFVVDKPEAAAPQVASGKPSAPAEVAASDSQLPDLLGSMQEKLGKILGPMAGFIFEETLESWRQQGPADISTIESLIELINKEIADANKIDAYRKLLSPDLRACHEG